MSPGEMWEAARIVSGIVGIIIDAVLAAWFFLPYISKQFRVLFLGLVYFFVMTVLYLVPFEMAGIAAYGIGALSLFVVSAVCDGTRIPQKLVISTILYLLQWVSSEVALLPWNGISRMTFLRGDQTCPPEQLFRLYILALIVHILIRTALFLGELYVVRWTFPIENRVMDWKEAAIIVTPCIAIIVGYWIVTFMTEVYETASGGYIWNSYPAWNGIHALFGFVVFLAVNSVLYSYRRFQQAQEEGLQAAVVSGQIEELAGHVHTMEKVYADIRSARHDINDHIMVLGNLLEKEEYEQAMTYLKEWKEGFPVPQIKVRTGNPVTDIILSEKKEEAEEAGIEFIQEFHYPADGAIHALDVGVILNNAIVNAIMAVSGSEHPRILVQSRLNKHAFLIEVKNSFSGELSTDGKAEHPETTKKDKEKHGYGLINMQRITEKYYGTIDLKQVEDEVIFTAMMIV